jgi:hypothetical protein
MKTILRLVVFVAWITPLFGSGGTFVTSANTSVTVSCTMTVENYAGELRVKSVLVVDKTGTGDGCRLYLMRNGSFFDALTGTNTKYPENGGSGTHYEQTRYILGQINVSTLTYSACVMDPSGNTVLGTLESFVWNGGTKADTPAQTQSKRLTFSLTNSMQYDRTGYVFCVENPGVAFCPTTIPAGGSASLVVRVLATDSCHYFAAFPDVAATRSTYGQSQIQTTTAPDGTRSSYWSGVVYSGIGASGTLTASQGVDGSPGWGSDVFAQAGLGVAQVTGTTATDRTAVTGTAVAATNDKLAEVGNSITQTMVNTSGKVEAAVAANAAAVTAAIAGMSTGGGGGESGTVAGLETLHGDNVAAKSTLDAIAAKLSGGDDFSQGDKLASAQGAAQAFLAAHPYEGVRPGSGAPNVQVATGGTGALGAVEVGGQTLNFAIGAGGIAGTDGLMVLARPVLLVALCIGFLRGVSRDLTVYTAALPQVAAQDTAVGPENLVPGVAQAKTWGTAAGAVLVVFGGAALLVALCDTMVTYYGGGLGSIFGGLSVPGASAFGVLDSIVPLAPAMGLTILAAASSYLMAPIYLGAAATLRFLKT